MSAANPKYSNLAWIRSPASFNGQSALPAIAFWKVSTTPRTICFCSSLPYQSLRSQHAFQRLDRVQLELFGCGWVATSEVSVT